MKQIREVRFTKQSEAIRVFAMIAKELGLIIETNDPTIAHDPDYFLELFKRGDLYIVRLEKVDDEQVTIPDTFTDQVMLIDFFMKRMREYDLSIGQIKKIEQLHKN